MEVAVPIVKEGFTVRTAKVERVQGLRRSNAAQPHRNRKTYTRKVKHKSKEG